MKLTTINSIISLGFLSYRNLAKFKGNVPIPAFAFEDYVTMSPVTSGTYQTLMTDTHTVEDVGNIEVLMVSFFSDFNYNGDGSVRWQISGDGGSAWVTMAESSFNVGIETNDQFGGPGTWISSISPGTNKLQIRLQALANSGTVNIGVSDGTVTEILYRKKVLF